MLSPNKFGQHITQVAQVETAAMLDGHPPSDVSDAIRGKSKARNVERAVITLGMISDAAVEHICPKYKDREAFQQEALELQKPAIPVRRTEHDNC